MADLRKFILMMAFVGFVSGIFMSVVLAVPNIFMEKYDVALFYAFGSPIMNTLILMAYGLIAYPAYRVAVRRGWFD